MAQGVVLSDKSRDGIAALVWRNMGDLEEQMWERQQQWNEEQETFDGMQAELEQAGLRVLNRPNLLNQNFSTTRKMPSSAVITEKLTIPVEDATAAAETLTYTITNEAITSSYVLFHRKTSDADIVQYDDVSATFSAGSATITIAARQGAHNSTATVTVYLCTQADTSVVYGNASWISGTTYPYMDSIYSGNYPGDDSTDGIVTSVATLTGSAIITEPDGETYDKAIQYAITANSAYGNAEYLMYYKPYWNRTYYSDVTPASQMKDYGQISEMIAGETYTMSCWVRVLSGDGVWLKFGYGNSYSNNPYNDNTNHRSGVSDYIKVDANGGVWQRVHWTFEFNPSGNWYTETSESVTVDGVAHTRVTRTYNWFKKVCFGVCRKYTATVQMCGFRLVRGKLFICETYDDLEEALAAARGRITTLESQITGKASTTDITALLADIADSETATATAAHAIGDLITVGNQLYKVTAAIAIGDTITATGNGANVTATTLEALIAEKAATANPAFTGTLTLGSTELSEAALQNLLSLTSANGLSF